MIAETVVEVQWHGPYSLASHPTLPLLWEFPEISRGGLYLWTVEVEDGFLVNYVGEGGDIGARLLESLRYYLSRQDYYACPIKFINGVRESRHIPLDEFLHQLPQIAVQIQEIILAVRMFVAPLTVDRRMRRRIESAFIRVLRGQALPRSGFLSNRTMQRCGSPLLHIHSVAGSPLIGIPAAFSENLGG